MSFVHAPSLADFIAIIAGFKFSVHTGHAKAALAALADTMHLVQHLIVFLYIRLECFLVKANIATTSSASANSASGRRRQALHKLYSSTQSSDGVPRQSF